MLKIIQTKLEVKYPGLSKVFLGLIASQMATKVTEESGIDAAIAELDNAPISIATLAGEFQKDGDRRVADARKEWDKKNPKPNETQHNDIPKQDPDAPEWAKALIEQNKAMSAKMEALESGRTAEHNAARLVGILKEKKVPESYYNVAITGRSFKDASEAEAYAVQVAEAYGKYSQEQINTGLKDQPAPVMGVVTDAKTDVSPMMKGYLKQKEAETKKTA